jgi:hypothetical protein
VVHPRDAASWLDYVSRSFGSRENRAMKRPERYQDLLELMRPIAREHGYALAVHGSQVRDLDLVVVPWVNDPKAPQELVDELVRVIDDHDKDMSEDEISSPHGHCTVPSGGMKRPGRIVYHLVLADHDPKKKDGYIELSFTPL